MPRFRTKPVEVEAKRLGHDISATEVGEWLHVTTRPFSEPEGLHGIILPTDLGHVRVYEGEWIIRAKSGRIHAQDDETFALRYEPVEGASDA